MAMAQHQIHSSSSSEDQRIELNILGKLFFFSVLMFTVPFGSYYGVKYLCTEYLAEDDTNLNIILPVFGSVITIWMIISIYAYSAYREIRKEEKSE